MEEKQKNKLVANKWRQMKKVEDKATFVKQTSTSKASWFAPGKRNAELVGKEKSQSVK